MYTVGPLYKWPPIHGFNQIHIKKFRKKRKDFSENSKNQNLILLWTNYLLHNIYIVLDIISNLETI